MPESPSGWLRGRRIGSAQQPLAHRRSGPVDEERWWRPADQALAEAELLDRRTMGRGWRPAAMVNNAERQRPLGSDEASEAVESIRSARVLTGLDEGRAWRHRDAGSLVVVRSEVYADEGSVGLEEHRSAWRSHAEQALDSTWRERWHERDHEPGWIEARWLSPPGSPSADDLGSQAFDWLRIEDHTPAGGVRPGRRPETVTVYEHLTVWHGRRQATVVFRHDVGLDLDDLVVRCANEVERRLALRVDAR